MSSLSSDPCLLPKALVEAWIEIRRPARGEGSPHRQGGFAFTVGWKQICRRSSISGGLAGVAWERWSSIRRKGLDLVPTCGSGTLKHKTSATYCVYRELSEIPAPHESPPRTR